MKKMNIAALLLLSALLSACGDAAQTSVETTAPVVGDTAASVEETTADPYASERAAFASLPELDLGGAEFVIAAQAATGCSETEIYVEEADGEVVNDAIFMRNLAVNERFNCEIRVNGCDVNKTVKTAVTAGDASYPLAFPSLSTAGLMARSGYLTDFCNMDVITLDSPWWDRGTADLNVDGKVFFMNGDVNLLDNDCTYLMFFNKKLISDYDLEEPYQLVRDGKWTLEVFSEMCQDISADIDGDGVMNENDRWGYVTTDKGPNTFFYGSGLKFVYFDENNLPMLQPDLEKITSVLDKVVGILGRTHRVSFIPGHHTIGRTIFMEDRSLFYGEVLSYVGGLREMESEFGILPIPKYDEAQSAYYTYCESNSSTATIPNTGAQETAALVLEAMAIQSYITVTPAYYDVAIQRKYSRDEDSIEMLDIALENRVYDMARVYSADLGVHEIFQSLATSGSTDFASSYAKKEKRALEKLEKLVTYLTESE